METEHLLLILMMFMIFFIMMSACKFLTWKKYGISSRIKNFIISRVNTIMFRTILITTKLISKTCGLFLMASEAILTLLQNLLRIKLKQDRLTITTYASTILIKLTAKRLVCGKECSDLDLKHLITF